LSDDPNALQHLGGAVFASRESASASGFLQYFIADIPVRPMNGGQMLSIEFSPAPNTEPAWRVAWEPHDLVEEYDQYSLSYFRELNPLQDTAMDS